MLPGEALSPCPECGGRGWLVVADGGAGTARPCDCRRQQVGPRMLAAAGIPERYANCRVDNFLVSNPSPGEKNQLLNARTVARRYVDSFLDIDHHRFRDSGLLFIGPPGVGKTHLAVAVLTELISRYRVHGRFVDFTSLLHQIQATFDPTSPDSKHEVLDPLIEAEVLVLDELGAQQPTPWVRDILYLIINQRYTHRRPTLFTTNYKLTSPAAPAGAPTVQPPAAPAGAPARQKPGARPGLPSYVHEHDTTFDRGRDAEPEPAEAGLLAPRISPMLMSRLFEMTQPVELTAVSDFRRFQKSARAGHLG